MGYWGYKIFQSDHAYDLIGKIISDANGPPLYWFKNYDEEHAARDAFNAGLLQRLVTKYETEPDKDHSGRDHKIILAIALAMETGARLSTEIRAKGMEIIQTLGIPDVAREQMKVALNVYRSGLPYYFDSPGLRAQTEIDASNVRASGQGHMLSLNVFPKISCCKGEAALNPEELLAMAARGLAQKVNNRVNKETEKEEKQPAIGLCMFCRKNEDELVKEEKRLMRCGKCNREDVMYCSKECQKKDWKEHKKICGKGEAYMMLARVLVVESRGETV